MKTATWRVAVLLFALGAASASRAEDGSAQPPSIAYDGSRAPTKWIETPGGTRVAVSEGIEWKGVQVYLSRSRDLVGVDVATEKTLYARAVGEPWGALTFKEVTPQGGRPVWAVELSPGPRAREDADRRQYHDLRTGEPLALPGLGQTGAEALQPPVDSVRLFTCANSFHAFTFRQLPHMAIAAKLGIQLVGFSGIGGSTVLQHWEATGPNYRAKEALATGKVDVLTLSPIWLPDGGIENFCQLAVKHNPDARIMVQEFWLPNDEYRPVYPLDVRRQPSVDHDATDLAALREANADYMRDMEDLVRGINERLGRTSVFVVPVGLAASELREKLARGEVPGLTRQWDLFRDAWGHPLAPLQVLATYCHYAAIYRRSPVGLPVPRVFAELTMSDDDQAELNTLLQQIAWDAVRLHPMGGVLAVPK